MADTEGSDQNPFNPFPDPSNCNMLQIIFLTCIYGSILFQASGMISDGSELLLLVPQFAPVVGSIVLPILGAVPDGMMVLFSGLGPNAQTEVSVGVGALAGSTIMLLTLPWFLAILAGRVNLKNGVPTYKRPPQADPKTWDKLSPPGNMSLTTTGVGIGPEIRANAKLMMSTLVGYVVIQGVTFTCDRMPKPEGISVAELRDEMLHEANTENIWALVGLIICIIQFRWYLVKQWADAHGGTHRVLDDQIAEMNIQAIKDGTLTLRGAMAKFREGNWAMLCAKGDLEQVLLSKESTDEVRRMCKVMAPFFGLYDLNGDNQIDFEEFRMIFKDFKEKTTREALWLMFDTADADHSGNINFEEFVACFMSYALDPGTDLKDQGEKARYRAAPHKYIDHDLEATDGGEDDDEDEGEEVEDIPEDLADLDPDEQQKRIKKRAFFGMGMGTLLVLFFSDPMVGLLSELGKRLDVSPFYVSFILAPMASNASELVAAYNYAKKRSVKSINTSLSTLEGAAVMNNTFCLGIFLALVYFRRLTWEFTAETIAIVVIQLMIGVSVCFRKTQTLLDGLVVLSFYPLALVFVWVLENKVGLD